MDETNEAMYVILRTGEDISENSSVFAPRFYPGTSAKLSKLYHFH